MVHHLIQIFPLGRVAAADLAAIAGTLRARFRSRTEILAGARLPFEAFDVARRQYDADALLAFLFDHLDDRVSRIVGVTEEDLFAEGRNFVFGFAHMRDRVAVFSTLRFGEGLTSRAGPLYRSRMEKALTHELGHTFHVPHCEQPRCVMRQIEFLWQLDELDAVYCAQCARRVSQASARPSRSPEALFELAGSFMRRRRFGRAAAAYRAAAARCPENAHYHNDHGVALLALGDRLAAVRAFEQAIRLAPRAPHAYYNLGIVCRERGDLRAAEYFFARALERDEDPCAGARYLGLLHEDYFRDRAGARRWLESYHALGGREPDVLGRLDRLRLSPADASASLAGAPD